MSSVSTTTPRLMRVAPELPVGNLDEALAYYRERLGFEVVMTMPDWDYAIVESDGLALHLFQDKVQSHSPAKW
jgi:catechol 2,3-dioxygenase-like lactoylglutathione lyase family enzyme